MILDLLEGLQRFRLWWALALEDIRVRYMRSFVGVSWIFISFALFVLVKVVIFTPLSAEDVNFFAPYVTIGFFIWTFINTSIVEGGTTYISAQSWIKGMKVPLSLFVFQTVARNVILTFVNSIVVIGVMVAFQTPLTLIALCIIPFSLLLILNALWVTYLFAAIGARARDFVHMTTTVMRIMMFLTPIFWLPEQIGDMWNILIYNPLAHFIILFRDPLLVGEIPWTSLYIVCGITIAGWALAYVVSVYSRKRVVFWL